VFDDEGMLSIVDRLTEVIIVVSENLIAATSEALNSCTWHVIPAGTFQRAALRVEQRVVDTLPGCADAPARPRQGHSFHASRGRRTAWTGIVGACRREPARRLDRRCRR